MGDEPVRQSENDRATLRTEYQVALDVIKLLTDIRFRCLVFVTALITVANAIAPRTVDAATRTAMGFVGLIATVGIMLYELRNSQLYEAAMHRAKDLERRLGMQSSTANWDEGGLFSERPPYVSAEPWKEISYARRKHLSRLKASKALSVEGKRDGAPFEETRKSCTMPYLLFLGMNVKHDNGLALIYAAALGGWVFLILSGLLAVPAPVAWLRRPEEWDAWVPVIVPLLGAAAVFWKVRAEFIRHDNERYSQQSLH